MSLCLGVAYALGAIFAQKSFQNSCAECSLAQALLERCGSSGGGDYAQTMPTDQEQDDAVEMIEKILKTYIDLNFIFELSGQV